MQIKSLFFGALAASGVVADKMRCGFVDPSQEDMAIAQHLFEKEEQTRLAGNETMSIQATNVKVYFHVLATSQSVSGGYLSVRSPPPLSFPPLTDTPRRPMT